MTSLQAVGIVLIAFAVAKLAIAGAALRRLRAHRAGVIGASDPTSGHAKPWLFWVWFGWRIAAAALALTSGLWLLLR
jgi:hypothetical protein